MNAQAAKILSLALALSLAAPSLLASAAELRVDHVVDLPAVQVRPDAATPRVDHIVTLETVQVRPDAPRHAALASVRERVVTLATVYVRPTAKQLAEHAATLAARQAGTLTTHLASDLARQARP
ncbi:hypothetical protein B1992_06360 [Pseudoxanthomonas broegbernensis]|uniref:Uncharacterized protein n=1 Tax=Pseudoxanthomonas broegbernensis TaxID=83619 RepID=A0A7V8K7F1_9GAMM|nr:hypothetical protein [Pseudoxanthomonas broegbernensis]KAF1686991.1 hypothetical protein B1992_06360 [Pseudoxanthomonas broegbernensis]MBB6065393.1 hypothetical protein [Pseudoxanthomonas broegbernensis]